MKTVLFAAMLLAAICMSAQEVTIYRLSNTSAYPGKNVPAYIVTGFEKSYPGITVIEWEPVNALWRATYKENNRMVHVYYNEIGHSYRSVFPVVQNNVPEGIVTAALDKYSGAVYAITALKGPEDSKIYQVRLIENGNARVTWMDAEGKETGYVYRTKDAEEEVKVE